jgi:hypothetical protein
VKPVPTRGCQPWTDASRCEVRPDLSSQARLVDEDGWVLDERDVQAIRPSRPRLRLVRGQGLGSGSASSD